MTHEHYMQRCIDLASAGLGSVAPNPLVGAVIVYEGRIIGEGYHQKYGDNHAEINAIKSVSDLNLLKDSTLYVNLEPCSHYGKTPPCADAIIKYQIPSVVIGMKDPFSEVNGRGIEKLRNAGVNVITDVLSLECAELNKRFITYHQQKRPYIILKWAESKDGFIGQEGHRVLISNEQSQILVHRWRTEEQGIMAGKNTIANDNPQLNVRKWKGRNPVRITIDRDGSLSKNLHFFDGSQSSIVFTRNSSENKINLEYITINEEEEELKQVLHHLYQKEIQSIIIEGGSKLLQQFINSGLWDEARVFHSENNLNTGIKAPLFNHSNMSETEIGNNKLRIYRNR